MENIIHLLQSWGVVGLLAAAFTESFMSPILPDLILIPVALANPGNAIYYGLITTVVSVLGGFIGYGIGNKIGMSAVHKMIPAQYTDKINHYVQGNAVWAVFLAAMSPIPYKFVSITAGALGIRMPVFVIASFFGRAKRFMVEGLIIYYFGSKAMSILESFSDNLVFISLAVVVIVVVSVLIVKKLKKNEAVIAE